MWCFYCIHSTVSYTDAYQEFNTHAHHEVSLWSSGSCHSKEHYYLAETPYPPDGKEITSIYNRLDVLPLRKKFIAAHL